MTFINYLFYIEIKSPFNKEKITVALSKINPEPVVNRDELVFYDSLKSEPLFSLLIGKPNTEEFDAFVNALKQSVLEQSGSLTNDQDEASQATRPEAPGWNVYDEPPEFEDSNDREKSNFQPVNAERVAEDIAMLKTYLDETDIQPLIEYLEALKAEPQDEAVFQQVVDAYNELGINQGAVLTYAPYLKVLLSKSILS